MKKFLRNNGLSIVFLILFLVTAVGQSVLGMKEHNDEMVKDGGSAVTFIEYLSTGHFIESTFENWESEFLQMAMFVVLSAFLYQKGSSESKDPDKNEAVDAESDPKNKNAPWAVRKGGFIMKIYSYSLSIVFFLLFIVSFILHWYGSLKDYNQEQSLLGAPLMSKMDYLFYQRFWFESFQNWQSEFLSVFAVVYFSIYFRHKGSAQSKPVNAPDDETD